MARCKQDDLHTPQFMTGSLDLTLPQDSVARAVWAGLELLDFSAHDARYVNDAAGRSALNPPSLTGVWMLALPRGIDWSPCAPLRSGHRVPLAVGGRRGGEAHTVRFPQESPGRGAELLWRQLTHNLMLPTGTWKPLALSATTP